MKKIIFILNYITILFILLSADLDVIKKSNIIAYYPFNGNSNDESGNNYHGSVNGVVLCNDINKIKDCAYEFNGRSDSISTKLNINTNIYPVLTISLWVYPKKNSNTNNHNNRQQIFSSDDGGFDRSLLIQEETWNIFVGGKRWNTGIKVKYEKWCNIVVVFEESDVKFYYNNVYYSYGSPPDISDSRYNIMFGDNPHNWDEYFFGIIDNIVIYNCSLSKEEIKILYNQK